VRDSRALCAAVAHRVRSYKERASAMRRAGGASEEGQGLSLRVLLLWERTLCAVAVRLWVVVAHKVRSYKERASAMRRAGGAFEESQGLSLRVLFLWERTLCAMAVGLLVAVAHRVRSYTSGRWFGYGPRAAMNAVGVMPANSRNSCTRCDWSV